ncbi:MAG: Hint domain-containing protein [Tabrizicola sp.]|jgi:Ca2+-binding RTX toxin-like protein|nr:Hint domain-containing protein [Tabrizicola sp.]
MATIEGTNAGAAHNGDNSGGSQNDIIWGAGGNDTIRGGTAAGSGGGNDLLDGGTGADSIFGGNDTDSLIGGNDTDNDTLDGGAGTDTADYSRYIIDLAAGGPGSGTGVLTFDVNTTSMNVNLATGSATGQGTDTLLNIENVLTGTGNDTITGNVGNNFLSAGAGNDSIDGGDGADTIDGGNGNDSITGGLGADSLSGGEGDDLFLETNNNGADQLFGGIGSDSVSYSASSAAILADLSGATDTANPQAGGDGDTDTLVSIENIIGSSFADTIIGDAENNIFDGRDGTDTLSGGAGNDTLIGGAGADSLSGGTGNDSLVGGAGIDSLLAGDGNDFLDGGTEGDILSGGAGNDSAVGGDGADSLDGGTGNDSLVGDAGADTLLGGFGVDSLFGGSDADRLFGGADSDRLDGGGGVDSLEGGSGNDTLIGGGSGDSLIGGAGFDVVDYSASAGAVTVNLADTLAESGGDAAGDTILSVEGIVGSNQADSLVGNDGDNLLSGGDGADTIVGGFGSDQISGGAGDDVIDAGPDTAPVVTPPPTLPGQTLDWTSNGRTDGQPVEGGFTDTIASAVQVEITYSEDPPTSNFQIEDTDTIYQFAGQTYDPTSSAFLSRPGGAGVSEMTIGFNAVPNSGYASEVTNVTFAITDIDTGDATNAFIDEVTILAYDANGNLVPVTITEVGDNPELDITGNTVRATGDNTLESNPDGSILVQVAGPVAYIVIQYRDVGTGNNQAIWVSDVQFTPIVATPDNSDADTVDGGAGNDFIQAGIGADSLVGGEGNDSLLGEADNDRLEGGAGNDSLVGGIGNDSLFGQAGDDTLIGGVGADLLEGGTGNDVADYSASDAGVVIDLNGGPGSGGHAEGDAFAGVDGLIGSNFDDSLFGFDGSDSVPGFAYTNVFYGGAGNDYLDGRGANDSLFGGADNDSILGGTGNDYISGGIGQDSIFGGAGGDTVEAGEGNDTIFIGVGDVLTGVGSTIPPVPAESIFGGGDGPGAPDGDNDTLNLDGLYQEYGWSRVRIVFDPADSENGTIFIYDAGGVAGGQIIGTIAFDDIENITCFTPGTLILTDRGEVPVEDLKAGDLVVTRDSGLQPVRWVGGKHLPRAQLVSRPELQPVRIPAAAFGRSGPDRSMLVSPQHRVLFEGTRAELLFGEAEVLVPAKHLVGQGEVARVVPDEGVTYIHILFDRHEVVQSDGIWTESFQPALAALNDMEVEVRDELLALFPELSTDPVAFPGARLSLKAHEARVLLAAE